MLNNKKILLVEDSHLTSKIVEVLLNENGYETETIDTGEEAVQRVCGNYTPDLILMDIELAGKMDGIETTRKIIKHKDIPVVFLTANTSHNIIEKIKNVSAYGFVLKGMDKAALLSTVEIALKLHEANTFAEMFEQLFEKSLNELYIFHPKSLKFVAVNRVARNNLGYKREELDIMTPLDIKPEFDVDGFRNHFDLLLSEQQDQILLNTLHRRKDGSLYPVETNLQLFNYRGEKLCMELDYDLTERKKMETGLQEKETTLNTLMQVARDAIIMLDGQGKIIYWNPAAERIFGYSRCEAMGANLHRLLAQSANDSKAYTQAFNHFQLSESGDIIGKTIELTAQNKDGEKIDIELSLSALRIMGDLHTVGIVRDISERKRAQKEIELSHKQFSELAENAPIGILECDKKGNVVYVNQQAIDILGSPNIEETKKINLLTLPSLVKQEFSNNLEACMRTNEAGIYEINYESIWGKKLWLRLHIKPYSDNNKVIGSQIIIDDITKNKQQEQELRSLIITDYLTNIYNRRFFIEKLEEEIERAKRTYSEFSLIMLDIDNFKSFNDRFGHNAGDLVLKTVSATIKNRIRKIDTLARWGGEEFVVLLLDTSVKNASHLTEDLRKLVGRLEIPGVGKVTASFGVAAYCTGDTIDTLIQRADDLMYEAKAAGKNCIRYTQQYE